MQREAAANRYFRMLGLLIIAVCLIASSSAQILGVGSCPTTVSAVSDFNATQVGYLVNLRILLFLNEQSTSPKIMFPLETLESSTKTATILQNS